MALGEPDAFVFKTKTPWVEGDLGDLIINKNDEDPEHPLAVRIDPVMEVKPEESSLEVAPRFARGETFR